MDGRGRNPQDTRRTARMYQRRRAVAACQPCRARKTKCDNVRPVCGFCSRTAADCTYAEGSKDYSSFDPASLAILDRINHAINLLESQQQVSAVIPHQPGPGLTDASPASSTQLGQSVVSNATPLPPSELDEDSLDVPGDPATLINCEAILRWPIFRSCVPPDLQSFILDSDDAYSDTLGPSPASQRGGVREEDFVKLSGRFLAYVHVKNPILDCSEFRSSVKEAADNGIGWDGPSCLVLITCALGCFEFGDYTIDERSANPRHRPEVGAAMAYYSAAKKRLALMEPSLLSVQCQFFCGVLEMFLLRPVKAWFYFHQACVQLRNHLWIRAHERPEHAESRPQKVRRLEQRLYWSCMKSEYELRCEIPLPASGITRLGFPDMLPSPPNGLSSPSFTHASPADGPSRAQDIEPEEERSWFYYLAEISFRKMMNRAIAIMGGDGERGWITNIYEKVKHCEVLGEEINIWCSHIPPPISSNVIEHPPNEFAHFIRNRALACREWIHRPFLYYAIHQPPDDPYIPHILPLVEKCLEVCIQGQFEAYAFRRHHGTWYVARTMMSRALLLLAAVRSQRLRVPDEWREAVRLSVETLKFWGEEASDLRWASTALERIADETAASSL